MTHYAESEAHGSPERVARYLADRNGGHVPVADLAVASQLAALYSAAVPVGYGVHQYRSAPATEASARDWIDACGSPETRHGKRVWRFDYVHGRRMKIVLGAHAEGAGMLMSLRESAHAMTAGSEGDEG